VEAIKSEAEAKLKAKGQVKDPARTKVLPKFKDAGSGPSIASGRTQAQLACHSNISLVR